MIDVGIVGGEQPRAGELIRILINHPDVNLRWATSASHVGALIADTHRGLVGECDMRFSGEAPTSGIDVVFLCDKPQQVRSFMQAIGSPEKLLVVDLSGTFRNNEADMVYGLPELNRKALVRGAKRSSLPHPLAVAVATALLPMAKNMLLSSDFTAWAETSTSTPQPDLREVTDEIADALRQLQPDFRGRVRINTSHADFPRGILAKVDLPCSLRPDELRRLYDDFFDDHSFTFVIDREPQILDVANTNKCLLHLDMSEPGRLRITSAIDNMVKGSAGNAVHVMNLLLGLSERVGLSLKASAI